MKRGEIGRILRAFVSPNFALKRPATAHFQGIPEASRERTERDDAHGPSREPSPDI
jgi:hypothetical protein